MFTLDHKEGNHYHVVLVREKLAKRREDIYLINLALALKRTGFAVTLLTSCGSESDFIQEAKLLDYVGIKYAAWWIPNSICGFLRAFMVNIKTTFIAFSVLLNPPKPKPIIFIVDNSILLGVLKMFSDYIVFYLEHFRCLKYADDPVKCSTTTNDLFLVKWLKYADEIIVENEYYAELFKKLYPVAGKLPKILNPCIDTGLWNEPTINIERIIPDLKKNEVIIFAAGKYRKSSNFLLTIEAFEILVTTKKDCVSEKIHLIIAGQCKSVEEISFYCSLTEQTKLKVCASHVTFLRQLPVIHHKTLLAEATIIIHTSDNLTSSEFILAAMSLGKPIVAINQGIGPMLLQHRVSGILVDLDPCLIASTLNKLIKSKSLRMFLGEMSKKLFDDNFSFDCFSKKVGNLVGGYKIKM